MKRRLPEEETAHRDRWIIPYADFITLLFAVFAVLYAISAVDRERFEGLSQGLREALSRSGPGALAAGPSRGAPARGPLGSTWSREEAPPVPVAALRDRIEAALEAETASPAPKDLVSLSLDERGLVVSLVAGTLFEPGGARLRDDALPLLDLVASEVASVDAELWVEAHASAGASDGGRYPTGWELSAVRASALVRSFVERNGFDPARLAAAGYGAMRAAQAGAEAPDADRVDLVVLARRLGAKTAGEATAPRSLSSVLDRLPEPVDPSARGGSSPPPAD